MEQTHTDIDGFYATLRLPLGASSAEVEKAYKALEAGLRKHRIPQFQVEEAYRCLRDPRRKAAYDQRCRHQAPKPRSYRRLVFLTAIMFVLFLLAGYVYPGFLLPVPQPAAFRSGDFLFQARTQLPLGSVVLRKPQHLFPDGKLADAYLVQELGGTERWYPTDDLERHYLRRDP